MREAEMTGKQDCLKRSYWIQRLPKIRPKSNREGTEGGPQKKPKRKDLLSGDRKSSTRPMLATSNFRPIAQ